MNFIQKIVNKIAKFALKERLVFGGRPYLSRLTLQGLPSQRQWSRNAEAYMQGIFTALLSISDGAVIDVGVNNGQTLFKFLELAKDRPYFGFEPQSMAAARVDSFLVENQITNYHVLPIALSDRNGIVPIHVRGRGINSMSSCSASIVDGFRPEHFYSSKRYVYAALGDEVLAGLNLSGIALIKVDVEGAELEVLKGLKTSIKVHRPGIVFEVLHNYLITASEGLSDECVDFRTQRVQELEAILRGEDYSIYNIDGYQGITQVSTINLKVSDDLDSVNFVAVPREREEAFCASLQMASSEKCLA